ncbi:uncharacterized protein LOC126378026 [Pectinophora gossypiella]|uniref:uncharacterized protein LOC126378026 n=1 Tax=Pectinophora gossypiella TaxID=13191 RepID=UPI00214E4AD3|nr:uncharacterized protein LOC126378026 [Pectinophora gossypiella]
MPLNPLNELKRRLDDDAIPLPKRLCLAKNIVLSHHFPAAPKEGIVASWLVGLAENNKLDGKELKDVLGWINVDELTGELKCKMIQVVSQYLQQNSIQDDNIQYVLTFLNNEKISSQLTQQIDDYLIIVITLLKYLKNEETTNITMCEGILNNIVKYYKECKKKLEFIMKLLDGENLETVFSYLNTDSHNTVIHVCQNVLFPMNKKSFFVSFLQTLIRKDNIDDLMAEKGDNIQSVLKIMSTFFTFPIGRTEKNQKFLSDFIDVFVSCFRSESQLIFAFYIMVVNSLNMSQAYLSPAMKMPPIVFEEHDDKIKRNLFLKLLEVLLKNEVDISVRLTDTFGEKISKVEIKKTFMSFLQAVMINQLKLEGKVDKSTLQIIKTALRLDPGLVEQKINQILPPLMTVKKTSSSINESYIEMLNCLLETLFKLSRATIFLNQILPHVKLCLEASNTEQFELKQKIKECIDNETDCEKLKNKLITGCDVIPQECVEMYGKSTSELMFRQNKELLVSLQKDFEEHCLMMLEEGFVSPSIITLAEVLSAILSSFLRHSKMADHTVPKQISVDFWTAFQKFEEECLGKFGECILKLNYNPQLGKAFLNLCLSVAHLKLLNLKYSNTKLDITATDTSQVLDLSVLLPCLSAEQWTALTSKVDEDEAVLILDNLLLAKTMALHLLTLKSETDQTQNLSDTKTHLIKQLSSNCNILNNSGFCTILFSNLEKGQVKNVAKNIVRTYLSNPELEILKSEAVASNRLLLNAIVLETCKNMSKCFDNMEDFTKAMNKSDFDFSFVKEVDIKDYFGQINVKEDHDATISNCINLLKQIPLPYLEESYQLVAIFMVLATKKCCQKKIRKNADHVLLNTFEVSPKYPDLYKIFPVEFIFDFKSKEIINLLTLKIKTSNNMFVIKSILESAVKKVKTDSDIVKKLVELLLTKQSSKKQDISNIEYFSEPVFQITCLILPIIAKEKKAITTSAYRSILANLQEKLHKSILDCLTNIDFENSSLFNETNGDIDESMVVSENTLAALNAMASYSLTLSKHCETGDAEEIKKLVCLWSGLEFFVQNAIQSIQNPSSRQQHVESSVQLLNVILRHVKKLASHRIFEKKDQLFTQIWKSVIARLAIVHGEEKRVVLEDIAVTLKFLCELTSVECFVNTFVGDMNALGVFKKPSEISKEVPSTTLTSHKVSKYLFTQCLKANIVGSKCLALSRYLAKTCKDIRVWISTYYEESEMKKKVGEEKVMKIDDVVCSILRVDLDIVAEGVLAAKKIHLHSKLLDSIFSLHHQVNYMATLCDSWQYLKLFEGCVAILNSLQLSRDEMLQDRWPNFMQCYRELVVTMCQRFTSNDQLERGVEEKLAEIAHNIEKLTQSVCKRKEHVKGIAAYCVADLCWLLEHSPHKMARVYVEKCAALLLQVADSTYAAAFLRRALASSPGHVTLANMYTMYKRYHKYVGNS